MNYHNLLFVSMTEIVFILFVAFLLFGSKKMPEIARGLGKGYREFQKATDEIKNEFTKVADDVKNDVKNNMNLKDLNDIKDDVNNAIKIDDPIINETKDSYKTDSNRAG